MRGWRLILGGAGILVVVYGLVQLVVNVPASRLILVVAWLIGAVIIHDGVLSPAVVGIGSIVRRLVPDRGRRYLQAAHHGANRHPHRDSDDLPAGHPTAEQGPPFAELRR
jgi:hypothetical protein